jgi:hypothetical protein
MALAWSGGTLQAQSPHGHDQHLAELADRLDKDALTIQEADRQIARDTFDLHTVIQSAGSDPEKLFQWVRDHTAWVPYSGALRGPVGVLMDRLGNSLDRSLLLAEMLRTTGATVRLAHGTLSDAEAADAFAQVLARPQLPRESLPQTNADLAKQRKQITDRVGAQVAAISAAIGPARVQDAATAKTAALKAIADHWWVQLRQGSGWLDLDTLLPAGKSGKSLIAPSQTVELAPQDAGKISLEDSLCHRLVIRVVAEQWKAGRLSEATVLEKSLRPAELFGQRMALSIIPLDWPGDAGRLDSPEAIGKVKAAILAQHEWAPALLVGSDMTIQSSVSDHGQINPKPKLDPTARVGGSTAGSAQKVVDIFGNSSARPAEQGVFTAEWMEYTIRTPGQADRVIRRQIFDLLGAAARAKGVASEPKFSDDAKIEAGLAMLGEIDMLPLACQLSPEFAGHVVFSDMVAGHKAFADFLRRMSAAPGSGQNVKGEPYQPQPAQLYTMAVLRRQWNPQGQELYFDRINLLTYHFGMRLGTGDETRVFQAFDIVENQLAVLPRASGGTYQARLAQGILDTNLETMFISAAGRRDNAAEAFAASSSDQWVAIRTADDSRLNGLDLSDNVREQVRRDLSDGQIALVPRKPVATTHGQSTAWWVIDPATGATIGKGPQGYGGVMAEYSAMLQRIAVFVEENRVWICLGKTCYSAAALVATMLGLPIASTVLNDISNILTAVCAEP